MKYLQALMCVSFGIWSLYILNVYEANVVLSLTETFIVNMYLIFDLIRTAFILMQCLLFCHTMDELMSIFSHLESFFCHHLGHRICYRTFSRQYCQRLFAVLGVTGTYICIFVVRWFTSSVISKSAFIVKVLQLMMAFSHLFVIFYLDLLSYHLNQLNAVIAKDMIKFASGSMNETMRRTQIQHQLKCYKIVHYRLWMAIQRINHFFGYTLIALVLHNFGDLVYAAIWIFERIHASLSFLTIWRECGSNCHSSQNCIHTHLDF